MKRELKKVLTIAGSDSSGGAGIQADIKTICAYDMYAMSVITALTAQNTTGVYGIHAVPPEFAAKQIDCVFGDIIPDAVKIGMLSDAGIIEAVTERLGYYHAQNIVVDPVMVSTSGSKLLSDGAAEALRALFGLAAVITPNIPEAEVLCGFDIADTADMERAAQAIGDGSGCSVLVKGGHLTDSADDILYDRTAREFVRFAGVRIDNPNTHGTGCTLSSAIACGLAAGLTLCESVSKAKAYVAGALSAMLDLGHGSGPLDHMYGTVGFLARQDRD